MLRSAGVSVEARAPGVDEEPIKAAGLQKGIAAAAVAADLARAKALAVSTVEPDAIVIGADQVLDCENTWFDKPADLPSAADHLRRLSGRTHRLETCVACARGGTIVWSHEARPALTMRPLSDTFIAAYIAQEGEACLGSVGAYRLEGPGIQLFERIDGDFFAILGLPLLPLLGFLRQAGVLPS